jgi:hypothetical protein
VLNDECSTPDFQTHQREDLIQHSSFNIHHSSLMDTLALFLKTILFRPYVFVFLAAFLFAAIKLIGWPRTWRFWLISWATAFVCEFSSAKRHSLRVVPLQWLDLGPGVILL